MNHAQLASQARIESLAFRKTGCGGMTGCLHLDGSSEFLKWDSPQQAVEALRELMDVRCGRGCQLVHVVVAYASCRWFVASAPRPETTRAQLFKAAYRVPYGGVQGWPAPRELNPALGQPDVPPTSPQNGEEPYDRLVTAKPTANAAEATTADREAVTV